MYSETAFLLGCILLERYLLYAWSWTVSSNKPWLSRSETLATAHGLSLYVIVETKACVLKSKTGFQGCPLFNHLMAIKWEGARLRNAWVCTEMKLSVFGSHISEITSRGSSVLADLKILRLPFLQNIFKPIQLQVSNILPHFCVSNILRIHDLVTSSGQFAGVLLVLNIDFFSLRERSI